MVYQGSYCYHDFYHSSLGSLYKITSDITPCHMLYDLCDSVAVTYAEQAAPEEDHHLRAWEVLLGAQGHGRELPFGGKALLWPELVVEMVAQMWQFFEED